jgi:hypothetical protein
MDEGDLMEAVRSAWVAHGIMSVKETHASIGVERVHVCAVKKACSKVRKAGSVATARDAHLSELAKKHAAEAAMTRFETSARSRQAPPRSTDLQTTKASIFSSRLSWTAGD